MRGCLLSVLDEVMSGISALFPSVLWSTSLVGVVCLAPMADNSLLCSLLLAVELNYLNVEMFIQIITGLLGTTYVNNTAHCSFSSPLKLQIFQPQN